MATAKIILLAINILGGIAVMGSYITGLSSSQNGANALWGGTPLNVRPLYTVSMIISALGYFFFLYFILFRLDPSGISTAGNLGFNVFHIVFIGMLLFSALWMPLTNLFVANPSAFLWIGIRIVLAIVGLSSLALTLILASLHPGQTGLAYWLAVFGSAYFTFHTLVLDAILWPIFFRM